MKQIIRTIGIMLVITLLFYIAGAFANASFNIPTWNTNIRDTLSMFWLIAQMVTLFFSINNVTFGK